MAAGKTPPQLDLESQTGAYLFTLPAPAWRRTVCARLLFASQDCQPSWL